MGWPRMMLSHTITLPICPRANGRAVNIPKGIYMETERERESEKKKGGRERARKKKGAVQMSY